MVGIWCFRCPCHRSSVDLHFLSVFFHFIYNPRIATVCWDQNYAGAWQSAAEILIPLVTDDSLFRTDCVSQGWYAAEWILDRECYKMKRPKLPKVQNPIPLPYSTFCSSGSLREGSAVPLAFKTEACNTIHEFCLLSKPKLFPFHFFPNLRFSSKAPLGTLIVSKAPPNMYFYSF